MISRRPDKNFKYTIKLADLSFINGDDIQLEESNWVNVRKTGEIVFSVPRDSIIWVKKNKNNN